MKQFKIMEKKMVKVALTENLFFTVTEDLCNSKWKSYDIHIHRKNWGDPVFVFGTPIHDQHTGKKIPIETEAEELYNLFTETEYLVPYLKDLVSEEEGESMFLIFRKYIDGLCAKFAEEKEEA